MTTVERIREECKNKHIPISRLERDCGFSNGYINSLKNGTVPDHKLDKISERIGVSKRYLLTGQDEDKVRADLMIQFRHTIAILEQTLDKASIETIKRLTYYAEGLIAAERDRQNETS